MILNYSAVAHAPLRPPLGSPTEQRLAFCRRKQDQSFQEQRAGVGSERAFPPAD
jgi:hypothetical protein